MIMSSLRKGNVRPQLLRPVNGCRAHQAGCGFECSETGIHKVNVELVEKSMNGSVHTPLLKPPSLPEKSCFLPASGPDSQSACAGHA